MSARSRLSRTPRTTRTMHHALVMLSCTLALAVAAPASYDLRQDGDFNVHADLRNIVFLVAIPDKLELPLELLTALSMVKTKGREAQDRSDVQNLEAFVEPNTPYRVEIGPDGSDRSVEGDGRAAEVVIASRRRSDGESQPDRDELKLLGAIEQCGPERERDPVTLTCRQRSIAPEITPQVVPAST